MDEQDAFANVCLSYQLANDKIDMGIKVFKVFDKMIVMPNIDYNKFELGIREAAENYPTGIIKIEEDN